MADELIDIYDENNEFMNIQKLKSEAHRNGDWHRAVHIWIYNSKGEILLQLRSKDKLLFPDMWDISVAGHVDMGEEEPLLSALREIGEEIGLTVQKENLQFFKIRKTSVIFKEIHNNEFFYIYFLKLDKDIKELKIQKEELQQIKFMSIDNIEKELKTNPEKYTPLGEYWFEILKEAQKVTSSNSRAL